MGYENENAFFWVFLLCRKDLNKSGLLSLLLGLICIFLLCFQGTFLFCIVYFVFLLLLVIDLLFFGWSFLWKDYGSGKQEKRFEPSSTLCYVTLCCSSKITCIYRDNRTWISFRHGRPRFIAWLCHLSNLHKAAYLSLPRYLTFKIRIGLLFYNVVSKTPMNMCIYVYTSMYSS